MTDIKCANCELDSRYRELLFLQTESGKAVIGRLAVQLLTINSLYDLAQVHRKIGELIDFEASVPPRTGIKSEDIKPDERPALPTSREWLEEDGVSPRVEERCRICSEGWVCWLSDGHDGWHTAGGGIYVWGRWYTDGPFVEAK